MPTLRPLLCRSRWPKPARTGASASGDLVLMEALGGGLTWGSALVRM